MKRERHRNNKDKKNEKDRFSDLPDGVLHHIFSFTDAKQAVQSCVLSTRWKNLWKTLPTLELNSSKFTTLKAFNKFVSHILSQRDPSTSLYTFDLYREGKIEPLLLKRILKYVFSHNTQLLKIDVGCRDLEFPLSFFSCHTLTSLNLSVNYYCKTTLFPNSLNLSALTNLSLKGFNFCVNDGGCVDPFSTLNRLKSLYIYNCTVSGNQSLCISSATLANLTIQDNLWRLSFKFFQLSTPSLCTFDFWGTPSQKLCGSLSNLSSVKHVKINAWCESKCDKTPLVLLNWLIELPNTESLTVSMNTLEVH
jgi:hypothetical protein